MSRIGRMPVEIPAGVTVTVNGNTVTTKGPIGTLTQTFNNRMTIKVENNQIIVANVPIILAPIRMTEVGRGQSLSETVNDVFGAVVKATLETVGSATGAVTKGLKDLSGSVSDTLSEGGKSLQETTGKILDIFSK